MTAADRRHVLLIDDNPKAIDFYWALTQLGFIVTWVSFVRALKDTGAAVDILEPIKDGATTKRQHTIYWRDFQIALVDGYLGKETIIHGEHLIPLLMKKRLTCFGNSSNPVHNEKMGRIAAKYQSEGLGQFDSVDYKSESEIIRLFQKHNLLKEAA